MSTTSGPTLDAPGGGRPRKASVATRKLSARMDSEVADAFRFFDMVNRKNESLLTYFGNFVFGFLVTIL